MIGAPEPASNVDFGRLAGTFCSHSRVRNLKAAVVGAGALGTEAVRLLGLVGFGSVMIIDPDRVESHNLTRSFLLRGQVGHNKALALTEVARSFFPDTAFKGFEGEVADLGFGEFQDSDVIFSCVDSDLARLEIAYISTRLGIPVADGGMAAGDLARGRVSYFPGQDAACYGCLLTGRKRAELLTLWQSASGSCSCAKGVDGLPYPSTPMMASIIASLQVETALRSLTDQQVCAFSLELSLQPDPGVERLLIAASAGCPFHDSEGPRLPPPGDGVTIREYLSEAGLPDPALVLDWPLCVGARCIACGGCWDPCCRVGFLRRRGTCPRCGSDQVRAEQTLTEVTFSSPLAGSRFGGIGLPCNHPYMVRREDGS